MRTTILSFLAAFLSFAALANDGIFRSDEDHFTTLANLFEDRTGVPATRDGLLGWWTGRCYYDDAREKAVASVLVAVERTVGAEHGPAFPSGKVFKVLLGTRPDKPANWFDELGLEGQKKVSAFIEEEIS